MMSLEEAWAYFRDAVTQLTQTYVPLKHATENKARKKHEWMKMTTIKELKKRDKLWKKYKEFSSARNYNAYKAVKNR